MVIFHYVFVYFALIFQSPVRDRINCKGLALNKITHILFIADNTNDRCLLPVLASIGSESTHGFQFVGDHSRTIAFDVFIKDETHDLCLFFIDADRFRFRIIIVAKSADKPDHLSSEHLHCDALLRICRYVLNFLLGY